VVIMGLAEREKGWVSARVRSIAWLDVLVSVTINLGSDDVIAGINVNVEKSVVHPLQCPAANTVFVNASVGKRFSARAASATNSFWGTE
jgi:hypothetical protein